VKGIADALLCTEAHHCALRRLLHMLSVEQQNAHQAADAMVDHSFCSRSDSSEVECFLSKSGNMPAMHPMETPITAPITLITAQKRSPCEQ
jgi:hypothetical protein